MTWIKTISPLAAKGKLAQLYARVAGVNGQVDNILLAHSLRPQTLNGHMGLYKNVLHHSGNQIEKKWLEAISVYVSYLNNCDYCVEHHFAGYSRLVVNQDEADKFFTAVKTDTLDKFLPADFLVLFNYARKLTLRPNQVNVEDIDLIKSVGFDDGLVLEVNQVVAYFNYANRTVLGLGVSSEGETLGLSPSDNNDETNWEHS